MSESLNNGGPAFPHAIIYSDEGTKKDVAGMTLRDYFAAAALQAHIAGGITNGQAAADSSYRFADAMLKERARG